MKYNEILKAGKLLVLENWNLNISAHFMPNIAMFIFHNDTKHQVIMMHLQEGINIWPFLH